MKILYLKFNGKSDKLLAVWDYMWDYSMPCIMLSEISITVFLLKVLKNLKLTSPRADPDFSSSPCV